MRVYAILAAVLLFVVTNVGSFFFGKHYGQLDQRAKAGNAFASQVADQNKTNTAIDAAGASARAAVSGALNENRSSTHAAIERIRTVVVPGPCRDVDPVLLREAGEAVDRVNAKIRGSVRPGTTGTDRAATEH
ncbi:hypothetical protein ACI6Q5_05365 [Xanthomonas codiaei]|uniref:Uncharacterized protein n=1 Tax=Xanthomonas codiaei TaxID=56463 RepID=A0A2S7CGY4_9XANT|nr:hypothetical protein [Xanthomonas codiaei]PPU60805.1 hypothetical protein XcodCFBP4690_17135 [Xanthomonas codiaei]